MRCPVCEKEMSSGWLNAKYPINWTPDENQISAFSGQNDVSLRGFFGRGGKIKAYICESAAR